MSEDIENLNQAENTEAAEVEKNDKQKLLVINTGVSKGEVHISQNVVAQIIKKNVLNVEGVARFAPKGFADLVNVFSDRAYDSSMTINFTNEGIEVSLVLMLYFGCKVPAVIGAVQSQVASQIEDLTGANVLGVNVLVKDLVDPEEIVEEAPVTEENSEELDTVL